MTIKNGDLPASPVCYDARMMGAYSKGEAMGLSKREYFAAMAMQGMLNGMMCNADSRHLELISEKSVKAADALLTELERTK